MRQPIENAESSIQIDQWKRLTWLRHGFSTRAGGVSTVYQAGSDQHGDLNLGWTKDDDPANVIENRTRLIAATIKPGDQTPSLITIRQVHSALSLVVPEPTPQTLSDLVNPEGKALCEADGLMTAAPGVLLGIQTADCVPVFVVDTRLRAIANFHAGWRGTAARIVESGVAKMIAEFGSRPEDLIAAIGPSIGACCYSVGEEVYAAFTVGFSYGKTLFHTKSDTGSPRYLDLWDANRRQLLDAGIAGPQISIVGECTGCAGLPGRRRYFSHRCEHGFTGRMLSFIGIVEE